MTFTATPFASARSWYLATQSRIRVGTAALRITVRHDIVRGGEERHNKPVDIVSSLFNARLYDGVSINCIDNAAEAHPGPPNDPSERLGIIRRDNLKVWLIQLSIPINLASRTASSHLAALDRGTLFSTSLPASRGALVTGRRLPI